MKEITVSQYAAKHEISTAGVRRKLIDGKKPKGVKSYRKCGSLWLLTLKK